MGKTLKKPLKTSKKKKKRPFKTKTRRVRKAIAEFCRKYNEGTQGALYFCRVALGKSLNLSEPQFLICKMGITVTLCTSQGGFKD